MKTLKTLTLAISINVLAFGAAIAGNHDEQTYLQDYSMEVNLAVLNDVAVDSTVEEYSMELDLPTAASYAAIKDFSTELPPTASGSRSTAIQHNERTYLLDY